MEDIDSQIKIERARALIASYIIEAVKVGEKFYCVQCHENDDRITPLTQTRGEANIFNCVYCSSLKKWSSDGDI